MNRRSFFFGTAALVALSACSPNWRVDYENGVDASVSRGWHVHGVFVQVPESLTVSNANTYAPDADIVWHGEPPGDRRAQVAAILKEGISRGVAPLNGPRGVTIAVRLSHFHAVTPAAVARAPAAVHNIGYYIQVFDAETREPVTESEFVSADLEAYVGSAAVTAALQGQTQRVRIVDHLTRVTRGWLGIAADQRRSFGSIGR